MAENITLKDLRSMGIDSRSGKKTTQRAEKNAIKNLILISTIKSKKRNVIERLINHLKESRHFKKLAAIFWALYI